MVPIAQPAHGRLEKKGTGLKKKSRENPHETGMFPHLCCENCATLKQYCVMHHNSKREQLFDDKKWRMEGGEASPAVVTTHW